MPHITMRVTEREKKWIDSYAKLSGANLSDIIKNAFFEKLENEYDIKIAKEYMIKKSEGLINYHSHEDVKKELGFLNDEL